jgi:glucosamine kinase
MISISESEPKFYIACDGGGTNFRAAIYRADTLETITEIKYPCKKPLEDLNACVQLAHQTIGQLCRTAETTPDQCAVAIGWASMGSVKDQFLPALRALQPNTNIQVASDADIACIGLNWGHLAHDPHADAAQISGSYAVIIAGTGAIGWVRTENSKVIRLGGGGKEMFDPGSGLWIGKNALEALAKLAPDASPFMAAIDKKFQTMRLGDQSIQAFIDRAPTHEIASLAPIVSAHHNKLDAVATAILMDAGNRIGAMVHAAFDYTQNIRLHGTVAKVLYDGGFIPEDMRRLLSAPRGDALDGALMIARGLVKPMWWSPAHTLTPAAPAPGH